MFNADAFRLDWQREFKKLDPYVSGKGGVILLEYGSKDACPLKFNYLLKEAFGSQQAKVCPSLRIDSEWFTTRQVPGVLDEIDRLLTEVGVNVELPAEDLTSLNILKDNEVGGTMSTTINDLQINYATARSGRALRARADAIFSAMKHYVAGGGRFMVEMNDMPLSFQTDFWRHVWPGLSKAGGDALLLVIHAGPKAERRQHQESPRPDELIVLPEAVEPDSERADQFFDDLIEAFAAAGIKDPHTAAGVHLGNNRRSVLDINVDFSTAVMHAKIAQARQKT
jgi:hypothetical protein